MGTPSSMFMSVSVLYCPYCAPDLACADAGLLTDLPWGGISWTLDPNPWTERAYFTHQEIITFLWVSVYGPLNTHGKRLPSHPGHRSSPHLHNACQSAFPHVGNHDRLCEGYTSTYCSRSLYSKDEWRSGHYAPSRVLIDESAAY